jgi:hypothetical protein
MKFNMKVIDIKDKKNDDNDNDKPIVLLNFKS